MLWILICTVILLVGYMFLDWLFKHEGFEKVPGPKGVFIFENALDFLMDPVRMATYFRHLGNRYKDLYKVKMGWAKFLIIHNPEDVELVISGMKNSSKGCFYQFLQPWLQEGLLLSDGAKWHQRRKILTPTFHFNILRHFHLILEENSQKLVEQLQAEVGKSKIDLSSIISDYTLHSICETAMGIQLDTKDPSERRKYKNCIHTMGQLVVYRGQRVWTWSRLFNLTAAGRKQAQILKKLSSFRDGVINKRIESNHFQNLLLDLENYNEDDILTTGKKRLAMLDLLLHAEKKGTIDAKGIGEEVDTFMFEGHDTTATALHFAFMALANKPEAQDKIVEECDNIFGASDRPVTMDDLSRMKYLECCIKETLRLYPPVHFMIRNLSHPMTLMKQYEVPAGIDCCIMIYDLHRRGDQFVQPLEFIPERFLGEPTWHPYSYIPFSAGPRNCIGQKFALMEMKIAISSVLRRYRLLPVTRPRDIIYITDFILRPKNNIYVKLEKRY